MFQFFVKQDQVLETQIVLYGKDVNHIKNVLRLRAADELRISDEYGQTWYCALSELGNDKIIARILYKEKESSELPAKIYLFQGLPKGDKMDLIIQKTVELGVFEIIPVAMRNCVVKLDEKKAVAKQRRWQGIAESAAKQAKRNVIPHIHEVMSFTAALQYAQDFTINLLPYENEAGMEKTRQIIGQMGVPKQLGVFIGPEGGFDRAEIERAKTESKFEILSLGKRILRTETAGMTMLSILLYHFDE